MISIYKTRAELEARRIEAIPDIQGGMKDKALQVKYGVTRSTVEDLYAYGPRYCGLDLDSWDARSFRDAIERMVGVRFHEDHVRRMLHKLGVPIGIRGVRMSKNSGRKVGGSSASTVQEPTHPAL